MDMICIGAGAAGIFAALWAKKSQPQARVVVLEKSAKPLSKVRISGGGRCNVTHNCFDPKELVGHYPRGSRELLGPFHHFQPRDTIEWFERRGVKLKAEADGRIFPVSDSSQTIIDCLLNEAEKLGVEIHYREKLGTIEKRGETFCLGDYEADRLLLATGSSEAGFEWVQALGHTVVPPVPSLFTFNVPEFALESLAGVSVEKATLKVGKFEQSGPLLITHWGFSGPAALKLSAWAARFLHEKKYRVELRVQWADGADLLAIKKEKSSLKIESASLFGLPKSLWRMLVARAKIDPATRWGEIKDRDVHRLSELLVCDSYTVEGRTTNKSEFVTCGGVKLSEVDFKTMESKRCPGLFFAGEILDIDGVTGGFNFQNAWTTGYLAGLGMSR